MTDLEELQQKQDEEPEMCPACDSADAEVLGALGLRVHYRCRACGWEYSTRTSLKY